MTEMITVYRNDQPVQLTREAYDATCRELETNRANAETIAHYSTRGGKYQIIAKRYTWEGQTCYDTFDLTSGKPSGSGGGAMTPEQFAMYLGRMIYFGRRCGTNYRAIIAHADTEALLKQAAEQEGK